MDDFVIFQMWEPFRRSLIRGHQFYVEQAENRLLSQFSNIEDEAHRASTEWLELRSKHFDPEWHDPADFYESALEAGVEFYELLSNMRNQTRLSVVAGMYYEWDKQLREWLVQELRHWANRDHVIAAVWRADFNDIIDLLEGVGWLIRKESFFKVLDACRLVVNVYKHGAGPALNRLEQDYPQYIPNPFAAPKNTLYRSTYTDHTHLNVNEQQLQEFSEAIVQFWEGVPENTRASQATAIPPWFQKAYEKA